MHRLRLRRIVLGCALLLLPPATQAQELRGTFRRDDIELHYRAVGSGAPLVFLSGGPGMEVDYLIPASANVPSFFQHIFLEQRGTGRSRPSVLNAETLSLKLVVDDLEALRVRLNRERLLLLGHSWGGMLAMAYAATYPTRVDRLILIGPGGPTLEFLSWFDDNIRARMRPEDVEARLYWEGALKRGIDADKATLELVRAITPAYFSIGRRGSPSRQRCRTD